jgi:hypothetical protein
MYLINKAAVLVRAVLFNVFCFRKSESGLLMKQCLSKPKHCVVVKRQWDNPKTAVSHSK